MSQEPARETKRRKGARAIGRPFSFRTELPPLRKNAAALGCGRASERRQDAVERRTRRRRHFPRPSREREGPGAQRRQGEGARAAAPARSPAHGSAMGPSLSRERRGAGALSMFAGFFLELRQAKVPVSLREYLTLLEAMKQNLAAYSVDGFYYLARAALVKDERNLDKFDRVSGHHFRGLETPAEPVAEIPEEWLRK